MTRVIPSQVLWLGAIFALAALLFFAASRTTAVHAEGGISNLSCSFSTPINPPPPVGTADTLTCTFDLRGTPHTLVVDFVVSAPPQITDCTLDGNAIHIGPCP